MQTIIIEGIPCMSLVQWTNCRIPRILSRLPPQTGFLSSGTIVTELAFSCHDATAFITNMGLINIHERPLVQRGGHEQQAFGVSMGLRNLHQGIMHHICYHIEGVPRRINEVPFWL